MARQLPLEQAFWSKVDKRGPDECWLWTASRVPQGYGRIWANGKVRRAHRISFHLTTGNDPGAAMVCHRCDNPPCCNPAHLFLGTGKDNAADCIAKGRFPFRSKPGAAHCQRGHEFTPENTYVARTGKRNCRTCKQAAERAIRTVTLPPASRRG